MPAWAERLARVRGSVDRELGESLHVRPMLKSQYGALGDDPARPAVDVTGVLVVGQGDEGNLSGGGSLTWMAKIPLGKAEMHIDPVAWPTAATLRGGDRVTALDRGSALFEIARVDGRRRNRLVFRLNVL